MTVLPWMPVFIGTELAEASHLTAEEFGAVQLLKMHLWQHGRLPEDDVRLSRIARLDADRWTSVREVIRPLFGDGWSHEGLERTRLQAEETHLKRSAAGRKGGRPRKEEKPGHKPAFSPAISPAFSGEKPGHKPGESIHTQMKGTAYEGEEPTRTHARDLQPSEFPFDPFPTLDEAHAFLTRHGVPENELSGLAAKLQGERLYPADLEKFRRPAA